jgi:ribonuclease VapC
MMNADYRDDCGYIRSDRYSARRTGSGGVCARDRKQRGASAANFLEAALIIDASHDPIASRRFDDFMKEAQIVVEPVTEAQTRIARAAYRDFGKGSGHPARLNFGDCFAYALAKVKGEPLLFKGSDFAQTDMQRLCTNRY